MKCEIRYFILEKLRLSIYLIGPLVEKGSSGDFRVIKKREMSEVRLPKQTAFTLAKYVLCKHL